MTQGSLVVGATQRGVNAPCGGVTRGDGSSDDALVARAVAGEHEAFTALVERYQRAVHSLAYRMLRDKADAADAAQETFVRAYVRLASYRPGGQFRPWLLTITAHWCIDQLRRHRAIPLDEQIPSAPMFAREEEPEARLLRLEWHWELRARLAALRPAYHEVLILHAFHELSYAEIAQVLDQPVSTVRMRLFRARRAMRTPLAPRHDIPHRANERRATLTAAPAIR